MPEVFSQSRNNYVPASIKDDLPSRSSLGSFLIRPAKARVAVLEEDEKIILILRQHPITLLPRILTIGLILGVGFVFGNMVNVSFLPGSLVMGFEVLWFLFILGIFLEKVINWYFNVIVLTDERVIDIDFLHLIYKNVTTAKIDNIEDVTYSVTGVFQSLLNYGNVLIQTAGAVTGMAPQQTVAAIEIWSTPNPAKVVKVINDLMLQEEQETLEGRAK